MKNQISKLELELKINYMRYAILTNEISGHKFTDEEKEFLMKVARGEISIKKALKIIDDNYKKNG